MYNKKANQIRAIIGICLITLLIMQQINIEKLTDRISFLEQASTTLRSELSSTSAELAGEHFDDTVAMQREIDALKNENNTQAAAIAMQAELISDYDQRCEDLTSELKAFEEAFEKEAPKMQLPTTWEGSVLTKAKGTNMGPAGRETYYNLPMGGCIKTMRNRGYDEEHYPVWTRDDGAKMFGKYVMIAANWKIRPLGTILETSMGWAIVVDTGEFVSEYPYGVDIAVDW